jgi:hypothetical protein
VLPYLSDVLGNFEVEARDRVHLLRRR